MTLLKMYKKKERKKVKKKKKILEYSFSDFEITSAPYHFEQIPTPFPVNSNIEQKGLINKHPIKTLNGFPTQLAPQQAQNTPTHSQNTRNPPKDFPHDIIG